ncbi:hypothetical protein BJ878DRAFT_488260 [Calycina marina]|uniref:Uncharacterized protein n=1 Tax=Calycina marina TaxID=1763456 RepID=A0A9P8CIL9_9HELO|nr:hypothetical protein BJ878DRAFT_488260 [Calycina marina]
MIVDSVKDDLEFVWIGTCTDKSSTGELQESIKSMTKYYKMLTKCHVHISDFVYHISDGESGERIPASCWFTRGCVSITLPSC